jgi:hypothetical protein
MTHCLPLKALLFGPPGNGKTCLAKKMAEEAGYAFINASGSQIFSMWKGETNKNVTALFEVSLSIFSLLLSYEGRPCCFGQCFGFDQKNIFPVSKTVQFIFCPLS